MKREKAYVDARRDQVLEMLRKNPEIRVNQLSEELKVSLVTIRRDLQFLEEEKLVTRTYGGAVPLKPPAENMDERSLYRMLIAKMAASFVTDGDTLFINTSRNAISLLRFIDRNNVTAITNNGKAIYCERPAGVSVVLTGGELRHPKDAMVGDFAVRNLQTVFAKKAFMGCSGISAQAGMTTEIFNEVSINELMIRHAAREVYLLADHTKIGNNSSFTSCPIEDIKYLITDELASEEALEEIRAKGVTIYQVHKSDL